MSEEDWKPLARKICFDEDGVGSANDPTSYLELPADGEARYQALVKMGAWHAGVSMRSDNTDNVYLAQLKALIETPENCETLPKSELDAFTDFVRAIHTVNDIPLARVKPRPDVELFRFQSTTQDNYAEDVARQNPRCRKIRALFYLVPYLLTGIDCTRPRRDSEEGFFESLKELHPFAAKRRVVLRRNPLVSLKASSKSVSDNPTESRHALRTEEMRIWPREFEVLKPDGEFDSEGEFRILRVKTSIRTHPGAKAVIQPVKKDDLAQFEIERRVSIEEDHEDAPLVMIDDEERKNVNAAWSLTHNKFRTGQPLQVDFRDTNDPQAWALCQTTEDIDVEVELSADEDDLRCTLWDRGLNDAENLRGLGKKGSTLEELRRFAIETLFERTLTQQQARPSNVILAAQTVSLPAPEFEDLPEDDL